MQHSCDLNRSCQSGAPEFSLPNIVLIIMCYSVANFSDAVIGQHSNNLLFVRKDIKCCCGAGGHTISLHSLMSHLSDLSADSIIFCCRKYSIYGTLIKG
jgi:hypothetical protein